MAGADSSSDHLSLNEATPSQNFEMHLCLCLLVQYVAAPQLCRFPFDLDCDYIVEIEMIALSYSTPLTFTQKKQTLFFVIPLYSLHKAVSQCAD